MTVFEESMSAYNEYIQAMAETSKGMSTEKNCAALRQYDFHRDKQELAVFAFRYLVFPPDFLMDRMQEAFGRFDTLLAIIVEIMQEGLDRGELAIVPMETLVDSYLTLMDGLGMQYYYYKSPELFERKLKHAFEMFWRSVEA